MKRIIALLLSAVLLLTGCGNSVQENNASIETDNQMEIEEKKQTEGATAENSDIEDPEISFDSLNDSELLQYVEDNIYSELTARLNSEDYYIEDISSIYVSKEYLEELEYNSKKNIYFGYTLDELDAQFIGTRYIFTLGEDGSTIVQAFEEYDDTYDKVIKNVAMGTGVILVCVTVSVLSAGVGAPAAVSMVFAASAKTGTAFALSSGLIGGVSACVITQIQTGDFEQSIKAASLSASEGFKWGAIIGSIAGGVSKALSLAKAAKAIPTPRESEVRALELYGGTEQVSFLNGKKVPLSTKNATRPDVVRYNDGVFEAIEVKNYNLENTASRNSLYSELERQVTDRVANLPAGSTQRIVLDVKGRGFSDERILSVSNDIRERLAGVYPDIPIDIMR